CSSGSCRTSPNDFQCGKGGAVCVNCYDLGKKCTQSGTCGICGDYGDSCSTTSPCCSSYTCQYDSFYGYDRCEL
ncbi:MAG TPA: hypothetical protein VND93_04460, partial [Myxococcales bacterium]|nr:hypothetical protein [Myxococcales bacterium]